MRARLLLLALVASGCLERAATQCDDGTLCPADKICVASGCALPEQVTSCDGQSDGAPCTFSGSVGACVSGVCEGSLCGNGVVDAGEACDDGNIASGDGCRGDCAKVEVCNDGVLDMGEACDDGNDNASDGCDACARTEWTAGVLVDANMNGQFAPGGSVVADRHGNLYYVAYQRNQVWRRDQNGRQTLFAGAADGTAGFSGDGGQATRALLNAPEGLALDGLGRLYIADDGNNRVRRVDAHGIITTVAGNGGASASGDGGPAIAATMDNAHELSVDGLGTLYIRTNSGVRYVDPLGIMHTSSWPSEPTFAPDGTPYVITRLSTNLVYRVESNGSLTLVAGGGASGLGDGGPATSADLIASALAFTSSGELLIADTKYHRIRRVGPTGQISTIVGNGSTADSGDAGPATSAGLSYPTGMAVTPTGLVVANGFGGALRQVDASGTISTLAKRLPHPEPRNALTEVWSANDPARAMVAPNGDIYIATTYEVWKYSADHLLRRVAGGGTGGDGGLATAAQLSFATGLAVDAAGNLFIAEAGMHRIRKVDANGIISTVAGTGTGGYDGDGALATTKQLNTPEGIAFDAAGNLYIADMSNHRIRKVDAAGMISTFAGTGVNGLAGDNQLATNAKLNSPQDVAVRGTDVFIADTLNARIRRVDATGKITTYAGSTAGFGGDGGSATTAKLTAPAGVSVDANGALYIADTGNTRIRLVSPTGTITTVAGQASSYSGIGGPATAATFYNPRSVSVDPAGGFVFPANALSGGRLHRVDAQGRIWAIAGGIDPDGMGQRAIAHLLDPRAFVNGNTFSVVAGGLSGTLQILRSDRIEVGAGRYAQFTDTANLARFRSSTFGTVGGVALDEPNSLVYITEGNRVWAITMVDPADVNTWTLAALVNATGVPGYADGAASGAKMRAPTGLFLDAASRTLYVADTGNHAIRAIDLATQTVTTVAGTGGVRGFFGDGGGAASALMYQPREVTRCGGDLFVSDTGNNRVRRVRAGVITTVVGDGSAASSGEGAPATTFPVDQPLGLACDSTGNLFVASATAVRELPAGPDGIDGTGPVLTIYGRAPRDQFPASVTTCLTGLVVANESTVQVADSCTGLLVQLHRGVVP